MAEVWQPGPIWGNRGGLMALMGAITGRVMGYWSKLSNLKSDQPLERHKSSILPTPDPPMERIVTGVPKALHSPNPILSGLGLVRKHPKT